MGWYVKDIGFDGVEQSVVVVEEGSNQTVGLKGLGMGNQTVVSEHK